VFVSKHFFHYKYDYREEWLRFTRTLSDDGSGDDLPVRSIRGIAQIVESPGGILCLRNDTGAFAISADWNLSAPREAQNVPPDHELVRFLEDRVWVVDLDEYEDAPEVYAGLGLPDWMDGSAHRFIVPLMHEDALLGFIVLARPRTEVDFNWEDHDVLKTAGRQVAAHLAQMLAAQALTEARQFETFNRLSAFVVHDLKNLVAQLSLLVCNAEKHGTNPEFVRDMVTTVGSSVSRMNRLLEQLRAAREHGVGKDRQMGVVRMAAVIREVIAARSGTRPQPQCEETDPEVLVATDLDRMASVLSHLVQNAQEATPGDGRVVVRLRREGDRGIVLIEDTGNGMDAEFIRKYLFQPFYTTKGGAGMGIGAYEAREFARALGGDLTVHSVPNQGTTVRLEFPVASTGSTVACGS
jgi:putative PEP-CTERM system histidine kinase